MNPLKPIHSSFVNSRKNFMRMACTYLLQLRTNVSEERSASIIMVTRIGELGTLTVTSNRRTLRRNTTDNADSCDPDDGSATFLRNLDS
jgi:hypothetical protein